MRGVFRRKPRTLFPDDMLERLDRLGRSKIDIMGSGVDWPEVVRNCIGAFHEQATADPDRFLSDLTRLIENDNGGFATYGASSLMLEIVPESRRTEVGAALLDRAIEFKSDAACRYPASRATKWSAITKTSTADDDRQLTR